MIHKGSRIPRKILKGGREVHWLTKGGRTIYTSPKLVRAVTGDWLEKNVKTTAVIAEDADGKWFEVDVDLPDTFAGSAASGWTDGAVRLGLFWSDNLTSWRAGCSGWIDAPGKSPESLPGDRVRFHARYETAALIRKGALIDLRLTTARHGKSITEVRVFDVPVSLPNYPYAMPAHAAVLEADLIAEGFTGAAVSTSAGTWDAEIRNYDKGYEHGGNPVWFGATWSGDDITEIRRKDNNTLVSLPGYPYTMPADEAALEADLIAAGFAYASVMLSKDEWSVFLPDVASTGIERRFEITITPGDPKHVFNFFGTLEGIDPRTRLTGQPENIRIGGVPEEEARRGFARLGFVNPPPG